ncbi:sugar kinase [Streptomyces sp. NPDC052309]|uniref:sugar kinase n=1 Tax=Streptomyces sp. NPDC052309 TaxID=3155421 RepID=UPI003436C383
MSAAPLQALTFGETMLSLQVDGALTSGGTARTAVAGAESNVAVGLARLGHQVGWAGRLGADEPGRMILRTLRGEGVHVDHATVDSGAPTGALMRERRIADLARVHYWRAGSAASHLRPPHVRSALSAGARLLHLTGITCALGPGPLDTVRAAAEHAAEHGWTVSFDVNHRTRLWDAATASAALRPLLGLIDIVIASDDELPLIAGDPGTSETDRVAELLARGVQEVVVKRGAQGADLYLGADRIVHAPVHPVPVVDTVGAGDAFCAGYLSGVLDELPPGQRLHRATRTAAFAVAGSGDWEGLPHRDELHLLDAAPGATVR